MKLWIDVEDLFEYASQWKQPSGIQRLAIELQTALAAIDTNNVSFVRQTKDSGSFVSVPFSSVSGLFSNFAESRTIKKQDANIETLKSKTNETSLIKKVFQKKIAALPPRVQEPARRLRRKLADSLEAFKDLIFVITEIIKSHVPAKFIALSAFSRFEDEVKEGDWLVVISSSWPGDFSSRVIKLRGRYGIKLAILIYDIIPLRRPEWVDGNVRRDFAHWFHAVLPLADAIFAISKATADDVTAYTLQAGIALRGPVVALPLGTGFGNKIVPLRTSRLPPPQSYALIVSTVEARKNHVYLFRIWRHLVETIQAGKVPVLVFAGRIGWLTADLMQQLDNCDWLGGKILMIDSPSDAELAALYRDCMFTIFPSFYEGWGLPVSESLVYGAPCLASNRSSMPEAGGKFARYFDPDNLADGIRAVTELINNPETLQAWREQICNEFQVLPWTVTAKAMLDHLSGLSKAS